MDAIRHGRAVSPWFIPNGNGEARDLHGITDISGGSSLDSEDVYVIGKEEKCATDKGIPEATVSVTQLERGEINSYLTLANLDAEPSGGLTLSDFSAATIDLFLYEREEFSGAIVGTTWFPKTAINSLNLDIADAEARIERSFELSGDNKHELSYDNKIGVHVKDTAPSGTSGSYVIDLTNYGVPATDPNNSGAYILRVERTRAGTTETITAYAYNPIGEELTITSALTDDIYDVYYSTSAFGSEGDPTSVDSGNPCFLKADSVTVLISDGNTEVELDVLTSLSFAASLERLDEAVIGNDEKVLKEISATPVDVSLTGRVKNSTILDAFMGQIGNDWGITDINLFLSNVRVTVKIYTNATKSTFAIGYQVDGLSFSDDSKDFTANEFGELSVNAASDNLLITTTENDLV